MDILDSHFKLLENINFNDFILNIRDYHNKFIKLVNSSNITIIDKKIYFNKLKLLEKEKLNKYKNYLCDSKKKNNRR